MRRLTRCATAFLSGLLFLAGCGGTPTTVTTTGGTPASVAVQAGDGQQAEAGAAVAVKPAVLVRNAASQPVAGVTVTFSVDSGLGTLTGATATTASNGIATLGGWTLGPAQGRNVLRVTVAGLPPVFVIATATAPAVVVLTQNLSIGSGGGTFTYAKTGDPLNGLKLTVPAAAYRQSTQWTLTAVQGGPSSLPADVFTVAPMLIVTNGTGYADSIMTLRIPVQAGVDTALGAFFYDPANGTLEMAPIISREASAITIATRHFSADQLVTPATSFPPPATSRSFAGTLPARVSTKFQVFKSALATLKGGPPAFGSINLVILGAKQGALLAKNITTSFTLGQDDWEFEDRPTWLIRGPGDGMAISSLYYNYRFKSLSEYLFNRYNTNFGTDFWGVNPRGLRLASVATQYAGDWESMTLLRPSLIVTPDQLVYHSLLLAMYVTGRAQFLVEEASFFKIVVVFGADPGVLHETDPNRPGVGSDLLFAGTSFTPYSDRAYAGGPLENVTGHTLIGVSGIVQLSRLDADWRQFAAGTIGDAEFPIMPREYYNYATDTWDPIPRQMDTLHLASDTFLVRNKCSTCGLRNLSAALPTRQYTEVFNTGGVSVANDRPDAVRGALVWIDSRETLGLMSSAIDWQVPLDPTFPFVYTDFRWLTVVSFYVVSSSLTPTVNTPVAFTAYGSAVVPGSTYVWDFQDGTSLVSVVNDSNVTHTFSAAGTYRVAVEVHSPNGTVRNLASVAEAVRAGTIVYINPSPLTATDGVQAGLTALVQGTLPTNVDYSWSFGDGSAIATLRNNAGVRHTWNLVGTYPVTLTLRNAADTQVIAQTTSTACVGTAWRITSFSRIDSLTTLPDSTAPPSYSVPLANLYGYLDQVGTIPSDGLFYLGDGTFFAEQGVYFQVAPIGTGAAGACWLRAGYLLPVARVLGVNSSYSNTGTANAGTVSGTAYSDIPSMPTSIGNLFLNTFQATKSGRQLTGTVRFAAYIAGGSRTYQFTATRVGQ